jgi:arylsulfatase A-like enzyme
MKTKRIPTICGAMLPLFLGTGDLHAQDGHEDKPNILWLTFEDTSWYELGCYGNEHVQTARIDSMASHGIQFMNAWSVAPQSSPARSSLITGCYATTYGMDIHPRPVDTPRAIFFPELLREQGYFCTNNSKTHYNTTFDNTLFWDECSDTASYNSDRRGDNQPFFSVFNTVTSHMGRLRTFHLDGRRDYTREGVFPAQLPLPPYVPDTYEMRSDYAAHLEAVQDVDEWVGLFISDLKEKNLLENTLIFVFSDNGGCLPRGKGYLYETGLKVPLIIHVPRKWQHLITEAPGTKVHAPVSFIDLAPTVLSLAGIHPPEQMQGQAIVGKQAANREKNGTRFAFGSNQLHHFMPVRAATNGRYKYIRSYVPYKQFALRNYYQWGMPANKSWDKLVLEKQMANPTWLQPYSLHPAEMLFDIESDPFELNNLAGNPHYETLLIEFREAVSQHIRETGDLGFFIPSSREGVNLYEKVKKTNYPLEQLYAMAELVGATGEDDMPMLINALGSDDPNMRYWAAVACAQSAVTGNLTRAPRELIRLIKDPDPYVACEAAYAVTYLNETEEGIHRLLYPANEEERKIGYSLLESLSMNPAMHPLIQKHADELIDKANSLPATENEDCGFMVKGILANIGLISVDDIYGKESYEQGLKLNRGRRPKNPTP